MATQSEAVSEATDVQSLDESGLPADLVEVISNARHLMEKAGLDDLLEGLQDETGEIEGEVFGLLWAWVQTKPRKLDAAQVVVNTFPTTSLFFENVAMMLCSKAQYEDFQAACPAFYALISAQAMEGETVEGAAIML